MVFIMHSQVMKVTPALAKTFLDDNNTFNRNVSRHTVLKYAEDMASGNWHLNHQGIGFDDNGTLVDGQHRLWAIVESGKTVEIMVTWGANRVGIDELRARSPADVVKFGELSDWLDGKSIACAKGMWVLNVFISGGKTYVKSTSALVSFAEKNKDAIVFSESLFGTNSKGISSAMCRAVVAFAYYHYSEQCLTEFVETLYSGVVSTPNKSAAIRCREMLVLGGASGGSKQRQESAYKIMRAIDAFCSDRPLSRLMIPNKPPFALPEERK